MVIYMFMTPVSAKQSSGMSTTGRGAKSNHILDYLVIYRGCVLVYFFIVMDD